MADRRMTVAGPGVMLLSAGIFAYFGFMSIFPANPLGTTLHWTLRVTAVAFFAAALLTMALPRPGNVLYAAVGLLSALAFLFVVIWDYRSPDTCGVALVLLLVFAAWNGYGSWNGLKETMRRGSDE